MGHKVNLSEREKSDITTGMGVHVRDMKIHIFKNKTAMIKQFIFYFFPFIFIRWKSSLNKQFIR